MTAHPDIARTTRFARRRSQVLDAASRLINRHGTRGMTLTAVARALDLDTSSVTYYFKRKEQLAAACIERTLLWARGAIEKARGEPDPTTRVRSFLHAHFEMHRGQREPESGELALTSDMRALDTPSRLPLEGIAADNFAMVRGFFAEDGSDARGSRSLIAATHLMACINWLPAWLDRYQARDLDRVEARLFDVLSRGLASPGFEWPSTAPVAPAAAPDTAQARFLAAATRLINRDGYAGASVERIAAELGVSTGSFYHHLENKDELVLTCFHRSFDAIEAAQGRGDAAGRNEGERLALAAAELVALQFGADSPLLRMSAYQALPLELRGGMLKLGSQVTRHVAGTVADGIADGSLRAVDSLIASQTVMAVISAAPILHPWAAPRDRDAAVSAYLAPLHHGLFG